MRAPGSLPSISGSTQCYLALTPKMVPRGHRYKELRPPNTQTTAFKAGNLYALSMSGELHEVIAGWDWGMAARATFGDFTHRRAQLPAARNMPHARLA